MPEGWYEVVSSETRLTQGDLITQCPLVSWKRAPVQMTDQAALRALTEAVQSDVIVLTQACDLEHEKVDAGSAVNTKH